jgi:hypothetical protein
MDEMKHGDRSTPFATCRRGHTLLEVIVAGGMMVVAIVPALGLMRDGAARSRDLEARQLLTTLGVGLLDRELATAAASWQTTTASGDFSAEGHANLHYSVVRSDSSSDGGIADRLMTVRVIVWDDWNNDNLATGGEPRAVFRTKIAKLASYEAQATP